MMNEATAGSYHGPQRTFDAVPPRQYTPRCTYPIEEMEGRIATIDLTMAKKKLMKPAPEGKGWTQEQADRAEVVYRRVLFLMQSCSFPVVPNEEADTMWHQHILDTRGYRADGERVFGKFIEHNPFFGLRSDDDALALADATRRTREAYEARYGEPYAQPDGTSLSCQACSWGD